MQKRLFLVLTNALLDNFHGIGRFQYRKAVPKDNLEAKLMLRKEGMKLRRQFFHNPRKFDRFHIHLASPFLIDVFRAERWA
jgi:hypothetical protein